MIGELRCPWGWAYTAFLLTLGFQCFTCQTQFFPTLYLFHSVPFLRLEFFLCSLSSSLSSSWASPSLDSYILHLYFNYRLSFLVSFSRAFVIAAGHSYKQARKALAINLLAALSTGMFLSCVRCDFLGLWSCETLWEENIQLEPYLSVAFWKSKHQLMLRTPVHS